jgi:TonB-dependent starch-binding outer membrane protein SusC
MAKINTLKHLLSVDFVKILLLFGVGFFNTFSTYSNAPIYNTIIKGNVVNETHDIVVGAIISLKSTNIATTTNEYGNFELNLTPEQLKGAILVITHIGYNKKELKLTDKKFISIELARKVESLQDVVITNSYSKPKLKEEVVGSIVTVTNQQLQTSRPIETFDKMLEGLAAGVQVEPSTELGTPVKINIRGQNSLSALNTSNVTALTTSSQPLFVVDGVPILEQRRGDEPIAFLNNEQLLNPLAGINPDDIENISILKDAAATSIYGANASNGVIIITTKRGKAGKTKFNIGYSTGLAKSINKIKWLSGPQYHELVKEMYLNDGRSPFDAELLAGSNTINTPWFELVNRYSSYNNIDVDVSGGSDKTTFRLSGSYSKQQAIQKGNDYELLNFRLNLDHQLNNKFKLLVTMAPTITKKKALNVYSDVPIIPNAPAYNNDGSFYKFSNLGVPNPLAVLDQNVNQHSGGSFNGNIKMEYAIAKNLNLSTLVGMDGLLNKLNLFDSPKNATGESKNGFAQIYDRTNFGWISTSQINWAPTLKQINKFDITAGFEAREESTRLLRGSGTGFTYYRLNELSNASSQTAASSFQKSSAISAYGQMQYNRNQKYFLSISGRYDAASIFGSDINNTINSAIGASWVLSKEKFLSNIKWLDVLQLKASYGSTGNARIGSYQARGLYTFSSTGYNGGTSSSPSSAPNADLGWEKNYKTNVGIVVGLLKHINITVDFYKNLLDDGITPIPVPAQNGFTTVLANVTKMKNSGMDVALTAQIFDKKFNWRSTLNIGYNKNIIVAIKNNSSLFGASTEGTVLKEGISTSAIWGYNFAGIDPTTGRELYFDRDGKVTPVANLDRNLATGGSYLGDRLPKAQGGFINNFGYKGLRLTVNLLYSFGSKILIDGINENNGRNLSNRNQSINLLDRWQKPGDIATTAKLSERQNILVYTSSKYLYDNDYIKLSNVSLSYNLPQAITKKIKGAKIVVFGNATNLFYWYKQKSPEGRNGIKEYRFDFPEARTISWGTRISF